MRRAPYLITALLYLAGPALADDSFPPGLRSGGSGNVSAMAVNGRQLSGVVTAAGSLQVPTGQSLLLDALSTVSLSSDGTRAVLSRGLVIGDSATRTYPAGMVTQADSQLMQVGINDGSFGTQITSGPGAFIRFEGRGGPAIQFYARAAGSASFTQVGTIGSDGVLAIAGTVRGNSFNVGGTAGVSCTGAPTANFRAVNGIVTAC